MAQTRKANTRKGYDQPGTSGDPHVRVSSGHARAARPGVITRDGQRGKPRRAMNRTQVRPDQRFRAD